VDCCGLLVGQHYLTENKIAMQSGYSGTALIKKLGIKESHKVKLMNAPEAYFEWLENDISQQLCKKNEMPDFVHLFAKDVKTFEKGLQKILTQIKPDTVIWVSWYKKSAGIPTDLNENIIRNYALQNNLVDIKVCAVNEEWSGLKLVVPVAKRKTI
jgi:hypothetical protein